MTLILSGDITLRRTWQPMDPDAAAYITAVETADGQALEEPVKIAIDNFVLGCKADGIWNAIKASCILAGARTLNGALVPLAGTAPTNFNFVDGDYNRKTGLVGDGSTQYLDSNRSSNADPQDNFSQAVFVSTTFTGGCYIGVGGTGTNSSQLINSLVRNRSSGFATFTQLGGFVGSSRSISSAFTYRHSGVSSIAVLASAAPDALTHFVFARNNGAANALTSARIAFYSIGESLDLALLDARVTDLINKFAEVIP